MPTRTFAPDISVTLTTACFLAIASCGGGASSPDIDAALGPEAGLLLESGGAAEAGPIEAPACPASCDDNNPCTVDSCDTNTFKCVHAPLVDGTACQGKPCTTGSKCQRGDCLDGPFKTCAAIDQCHAAGVCSPKTGECTNPSAPNSAGCDDSDNCTYADQCNEGLCKGTPVTCIGDAVCDPAVGVCRKVGGEPVFPSALVGRVSENLQPTSFGNGLFRTATGAIFLAASVSGPTDLGSGPLASDPLYPLGKANPSDVVIAQLDASTGAATRVIASSHIGVSS